MSHFPDFWHSVFIGFLLTPRFSFNFVFRLCLWNIHFPLPFCLPKKTLILFHNPVYFTLPCTSGEFQGLSPDWSKKIMQDPIFITNDYCMTYIGMWWTAGQWDTSGSLERLSCSLKGAYKQGSPLLPLGIIMPGNDSWNWCSHLVTLSSTSLKRMVEQKDWNLISSLNPSSDGVGDLPSSGLLDIVP